jgi:hypothetical protein
MADEQPAVEDKAMRAPAIDPAGVAGVAAPHSFRRWRALLGGLLLALLPGFAIAGESEEWPTAPDRGERPVTRIPWMRFSGDPNVPVEVLGGVERGREVLVVREKELTGRQRRLLRRADRKAEKAAELRKKAGARGTAVEYAVVVPAVRHVEASPPRTIVIDQRRPKGPNVQVVRMDREHDGCDEHEHEDIEVHAPVVIDAERLSRDVERRVEQALRQAERARERAQRDQERAHRDHERAQRGAAHGRRRHEAAAREVERAMRDGQIDADERRRIQGAARGG